MDIGRLSNYTVLAFCLFLAHANLQDAEAQPQRDAPEVSRTIAVPPACFRLKFIDHERAILVCVDGNVHCLDLSRNGKLDLLLKGASFRCLSTGSNGKDFVVSDQKGSCILMSTSGPTRRIRAHSVQGGPAVLDPSGSFVIVSGGDSRPFDRVVCSVKLWDLASNKLKREFRPFATFVHDMLIIPNTKQLVTVGGEVGEKPTECGVRVWNIETGRLAYELLGHTDTVKWVSIDKKANRLLTGSADGTIRLWNLDTKTQEFAISLNTWCGEISPDGRTCIVGTKNMACIIDLEKKKELARFTNHRGIVTCVGFCPNGADAFSVSGEGLLALWKAKR